MRTRASNVTQRPKHTHTHNSHIAPVSSEETRFTDTREIQCKQQIENILKAFAWSSHINAVAVQSGFGCIGFQSVLGVYPKLFCHQCVLIGETVEANYYSEGMIVVLGARGFLVER